MSIYLDPSEASSSTRLPQSVIDQSTILPGLESHTGADFLITTRKIVNPSRGFKCSDEALEVIASYDDSAHSIDRIAEILKISLPDAVNIKSIVDAIHAGILVQRKSGGDFISSIPDLRDIRNRMLRWSFRSWLLITGEFETRNNHVVVDGRETGLSPECVNGAIDSWRMDGGQVDVLESDQEIGPWVSRMVDKLRVMEGKEGDDGRVQRYKRAIPERDDDRARALAVLATLKNIGSSGAVKLLDYYGSLAGTLEACLDPSVPKSKHRPGGVLGEMTVKANRELFGLEEGMGFYIYRGL
jgi:hypothetical protein